MTGKKFVNHHHGSLYESEGISKNMSTNVIQHSKGAVMSGLLIGGFVGMFGESALNVALSQLMTDFSVNAATIQWLTTGYLLVVGILLPMSSLLVRWFTTRQLLFTALACFIIGALISGLAGTFPVLLIGRLIQAVATGILLPLIFNTAIAIYPPEQLGTAMGSIGMVVMFAPAVGPAVAGFILWKFSWNWIFWLMVPAVVIAGIVATLFLENVRPITKPKIDVLSLVLSTIGFGLVVFGISFAGDKGWGNLLVIAALIVGAAALGLFCRRQLKLEEPILNIRAFRFLGFSLGTALVFIGNAILLAAVFLIPMYLQKGKLAPILITGLIMLPGGVTTGIVSALSGKLFDRYGAKWLTRIGFFIGIIAALILALVNAESTYLYVILGHVVLMIGVPLAMSPAQAYGLNALPVDINSDGSCIISTLQQIAGAIGTALAASFLSFGEAAYRQGGGQDAVAAMVSGAKNGFLLPLILAILAFVISFKVKSGTTASKA